MCGFVVFHQPGSGDFDLDSLAAMTHLLAHRGPDDFGFGASTTEGIKRWTNDRPNARLIPGMAMGHRRLSILDLSEAGRQPFVSADGRYVMVYNGEIFNYRELRAELETLGDRFTTKTDTEVVLCAFAHWGTGCFGRFNGMWALVIWDARDRTLVASRDRFGIKPLYFQQVGETCVYASEFKAILAHPAATRGVDRVALASYLADVGQSFGGRTFYDAVREVEPGTHVRVAPSTTEVRRYWDLPESDHKRFDNLAEAAEGLEALLRDAVSLRMRSDVRIGTMLSGGVDSTSVISMVRHLMDTSSSAHEVTGDTLQAFTAICRDTSIDEEPLTDELCRYLDVRANKVFPLQEEGLVDLLRTSCWHMERPYFNSVPMVHTLLMRKARSVGVTVVLNGHGPDEMLAGYPARYIPEAIGDSIAGLRWREALREVAAMRDVHGLGRRRALLRALQTRLPRALLYRRARDAQIRSSVLRPGSKQLLAGLSLPHSPGGWQGGLRRALHEDFFFQSLPGWLHLEDRVSMGESIEARLPFLDYRIVEFAFSLPSRFKIDNGVTKCVLREAMKGHLPESIVCNPRKVPFSGPDAAWIRWPLRSWVEEAFFRKDTRIFEHVDPLATRALLREFLDSPKSATHPYAVWRLVTTEVWLHELFR